MIPRVIRTLNPSKQAAADPHLRPRGHWDRLVELYLVNCFITLETIMLLLHAVHTCTGEYVRC